MTDDENTNETDGTEKSAEETLLETVEATVEAVEETSEKVDELTETVEQIDERVDKVAKGAADTDQIEGGEAGEESEKTSEAEAFKAALGGN